jgi:hypothetical protein
MNANQWAGVILILLLGSIPVSIISDYSLYQSAQPPKEVTDIDSFLAWKQDARSYKKYKRGKTILYVAIAPPGRILASGRSEYIFNVSGNLIVWTPDAGDDPTIQKWLDHLNWKSVENISKKEFKSRL